VPEVTVTFEIEKQTKNTIRFKEAKNSLGPAPVIGSLYVQKWALEAMAQGNISALTVTIEVAAG